MRPVGQIPIGLTVKEIPHNMGSSLTDDFQPSAACKFLDFPLECVSKCREMQFRVDLPAFQGDFPQA